MIPPSVTNSLLDPLGPVEDWSSLLSSRIAKIFASDSTETKVVLPVNYVTWYLWRNEETRSFIYKWCKIHL